MILIKKYKFHTALVLTCVLSIFTGVITEKYIHNNTSHKSSSSEERSYDENLQFISPLLECDAQQAVELKSFKSNIENEISLLKNKGQINDVAVYFRQLNDGYWFGINENAEFSPASLLKMPLMIAYLKEAEENPKILTDTLTFTKNEDLYGKQNFKPEVILESGKQYSVKDLIGRMIVYSDNSAQALLMKNASYFWQRPFNELEVNPPGSEEEENFMSVVEYARFFRILYNASYVNKQYSNLALGILAESKFKDGIVAGVPKDIAVAHKFGERVTNDSKQLHDCGIVYHPDTPYLLCIMTRGDDFDKLKNSLQSLSKKIFTEVDSQKK